MTKVNAGRRLSCGIYHHIRYAAHAAKFIGNSWGQRGLQVTLFMRHIQLVALSACSGRQLIALSRR